MNIALPLKRLGILTIGVSLVVAGYLTTAVPRASALTSLASLTAGDLIRGQQFSAVYYLGADGMRYVFPNDKVYFSWYTNFDGVKFISDADLEKIQIGGNATYRPGTRMVKINTDPKTYAVSKGGVLRHVGSEQLAIALYGSDWNKKIDDIPDSFFGNYEIGSAISDSTQYSATTALASATTVGADKSLVAPATISMTSSNYSPISVVISVGQGVKFINNDTAKHTATGETLSWGTGTISPGGYYIEKFDQPGTYPFFDSYNSARTGAIYVQ